MGALLFPMIVGDPEKPLLLQEDYLTTPPPVYKSLAGRNLLGKGDNWHARAVQ